MTTAALEKRVRALEAEVRSLKNVVKPKKFPAGLKQALCEVGEGKLIGPFHSVEGFMAGFKR